MKVINPDDLAPGELVFREYDSNGWPCCPECASDQMYSALELSGTSRKDEKRVRLHVISGLKCDSCGFELLPGFKEGPELEI